ncbi:MAG TPA: fused MFS/spermidine synthase, partial [Bryobacteraceae bacterium]|nr:fused MFS/spermidine synthase [Bryobacteraceae bacterium]
MRVVQGVPGFNSPGGEVDARLSRGVQWEAVKNISSHLPAALALGIASQIGQVVLMRELLMVFHGNELSIGIILSVWLAWVGLGSRLGARLSERSRRPEGILAAAAACSALALPAGVLLIRVLRGFFPLPPGAYLSILDMVISCLGVLAPVCLSYGLIFPCIARLWRERGGGLHGGGLHGGGRTYIAEAAGNFAGGLAFSLVLVRLLNPLATALLASGLISAAVYPLVRRAGSGRSRAVRPVLAALAALVLPLLPFVGRLDYGSQELLWRLLAPDHELQAVARSRYGAIAVIERQGQYSVYQSGNFLFTTAGPDVGAQTDFEEQSALVLAHFSMVQHPEPRRVLLIGGGMSGTIREIIRHPVERVDYIELDPELTAAVRPFLAASTLAALKDDRVRMIHTDGRLFVRNAAETYDLVLVDVPDPATAMLNRYYTEEFFRAAAALLEPDGVLVMNLASGVDLRSSASANRNSTIFHTMRTVFSQVLPAGERPLFFLAGQGSAAISIDPSVLAARLQERGVHSPGFTPRHFYALLKDMQLRRMNWIVRNHGLDPADRLYPPRGGPLIPPTIVEQAAAELPAADRRWFINRDFAPIGYFYTLV